MEKHLYPLEALKKRLKKSVDEKKKFRSDIHSGLKRKFCKVIHNSFIHKITLFTFHLFNDAINFVLKIKV